MSTAVLLSTFLISRVALLFFIGALHIGQITREMATHT
jgi:hypothetical protein